ncbi:MAG TPA: isochorismatase family cysteine hydrolase [Candidatus Binataceae bacterium]|nr:isochorismatase family cysteine hydrolase [Candidatus Binataceae bacterium]
MKTKRKQSQQPPRKSQVALLLIDVINDLAFEEADALLEQALPMSRKLQLLKDQAVRHGIPCIYVNDNFGQWKSDFRLIFNHCTHRRSRGAPISRRLRPMISDYFVLKPKHSGFYSTTLDVLLEYLQIHTLIITGIAANICVLFTANDAYMRDYELYVPADCIASNSTEETQYSLQQMETILKADIRESDDLALDTLVTRHGRGRRMSGHQRLIGTN